MDSSVPIDEAAVATGANGAAAVAAPSQPQGPTVNPASGAAVVTAPGGAGAGAATSLVPPAAIVSFWNPSDSFATHI